MNIVSISYQKVKNLGNYESERLEVTAVLEKDEDPTNKIQELRCYVNEQLANPLKATEDTDDIPY